MHAYLCPLESDCFRCAAVVQRDFASNGEYDPLSAIFQPQAQITIGNGYLGTLMDIPSGFNLNKVTNQPNDSLFSSAYEGMPQKEASVTGSPSDVQLQTAASEVSAMKLTITALSGQFDALQAQYGQEKANKGIVEHTVDWGRSWLSKVDQNKGPVHAFAAKILDLNASSGYVDRVLSTQSQEIQEMKESLDHGDTATFKKDYQLLTGKEFGKESGKDAAATISTTSELVDHYAQTQQKVHDVALALAALTASTLALRYGNFNVANGLIVGTGTGGVGGLLFRAVDGYKSNKSTLLDLANGSFAGFATGVGDLAGSAASDAVASRFGLTTTGGRFGSVIQRTTPGLGLRLLSATTNEGLNGAVYSAMVMPLREYEGGSIKTPSDALQSAARGAALGFAGGSVLGLFRGVTPLTSGGASGELPEPLPISDTKI